MLISKSDIANFRQISASVPDKVINPHIEDAELLDICPLLGEAFYNDIVQNPTTAANAALLNKTTYTYDGKLYVSPGLKRVEIDFAYARYTMFGSEIDTPFGRVRKNFQDGENVSRTDKKEVYKYSQQNALQYWAQVEAYLNRNANQYPLWNICDSKKNKRFRLSKITK